jgi:hypothetical protein
MSDEDFKFIIGIIIGLLTALTIASIYHEIQSVPKKEAIKHNCAEYNQITGRFQWKDKL